MPIRHVIVRRPPGRPPAAVAGWLVLGLVALAAIPGLTPSSVRAADPTPTPSPAPIRAGVRIVTLVPTPTPAPTATPSGPTILGSSVRFHGRGYGHGVGMSQYGARGRALAGQAADVILAHYYQGTTQARMALDTPIRVRVLAGFTASAAKPLVLYGRRGDWTIDGVAAVFPQDAKATVVPTTAGGVTTWRVKVVSPGGATLHHAATTGFRARGATSSATIQVASRVSERDEYRGAIRVRLTSTSATLNVMNELPLETYLRGVVPAEMPSSWPMEALNAQSIAARSYAARRLRPGVSYFDVTDDTSSQVYLGREGEKSSTNAAITATKGIVLMSGAAIANAMFHSAGGGATEHNENVYVSATGKKVAGAVSYLRGSPDRVPDGTPYDAASPYATWSTAAYSRSRLSTMFAGDSRTNVGTLTALDLRRRGVSGRLISVTLIGSLGTKTVSGNVFRSVFNARRPAGDPLMRSTLVDTKPVP